MKHYQIFAAAAALAMCSTAALSASADEAAVMSFRMAADKTVICTDDLASQDVVLKGGLYVDDYSGLTSLRLILKSDDPVVIENGGYTVDPEKKDKDGEPLHLLFAEHSDATYTQKAEASDDTNVVLWYAKDYTKDAVAKVNDAASSFVHFDVRIPKGTKPGDYKCYISEEVKKNAADLNEEDSFVYQGDKQLTFGQDLILKPLELIVYTFGDTNLDGNVSIEDAQLTLKAYTAGVAGKPHNLTPAQVKACDITENGEVGVDDAQWILKYYTAKYVAGIESTTWESIMKKQ